MSNYWVDRIANETWERYNDYEEQNKNLIEFYKEAIYDIESELQRLILKLGNKPSRSDMYDKNRLGKLKIKLEKIIKKLGSRELDNGNKLITEAIQEQYKEVTSIIGNEDFALPNKKEMEMMMNNPWSGMNFSERVWENNRVLASNLNEILTRGIIQGKTFSDMAKELDERMMKGFNRAHALIRTETMHYLNESSKKAYEDAGVNELEIYAAEDERTCEVCGAEHEKTYPMEEAPILPFHPNCRCTYLPIISKNKSEK